MHLNWHARAGPNALSKPGKASIPARGLMPKSFVIRAGYAEEQSTILLCRSVVIQPFERVWLNIRRAEPKNEKLVELGQGLFSQALLGGGGFLDRVLVFLPIGWPGAFGFVRRVSLSAVDPDEGHANGVPAGPAELLNLPHQVANNAIYLFDHGLGEDLCFGADLNIGDLAAGHPQTFFGHRNRGRHKLAKRGITAPRGLADGLVGEVDDAFVCRRARDGCLWRR
jgi:hypothetical protein